MKEFTQNLSSQAYAHVFSANFAADCVKNSCRATARLRIFAFCWKMQFLSCYSMCYITDAIWRNTPQNVKDMKKGQLGYYCQDISVLESEYDDFYKFKLDLSIMSIEVVCKEIKVKKELTDNIIWFWK